MMKSKVKNTGGQAFPRAMSVSHGGYHEHQGVIPPEDGMTLRDYFAAKAMQSILTTNTQFQDEHWRVGVAIDAFAMADAMLEKREKK